MDPERKRLADMVKKLRGDRSQSVFAERIGVGQSAVSNWESGSAMPRLDQIESLAAEAGILPEQFVARLYGRECVSQKNEDPVDQIINMCPEERISAIYRISGSLQSSLHAKKNGEVIAPHQGKVR